jgi:hypothetical protein
MQDNLTFIRLQENAGQRQEHNLTNYNVQHVIAQVGRENSKETETVMNRGAKQSKENVMNKAG